MIKINKIECLDIFSQDFSPLLKNNTIDFSKKDKIAIVYGPNGAGKTSCVKTMANVENTEIDFEFINDGKVYTDAIATFHVVNDQNYRNIIEGETKDYFLGENIRREYELRNLIDTSRDSIINETISILKTHGITAASSPLIELINHQQLSAFVKDVANNKSRGKNFSTEIIYSLLTEIKQTIINEYDEKKIAFLKSDYADKNSIIKKIDSLKSSEIKPNAKIREVEENTEAINILNRFHKNQCIVCDNDIDCDNLLKLKTQNRDFIIASLDEKVRELIEKIIKLIPEIDPFEIKDNLLNALDSGDTSVLNNLISDIHTYKLIYEILLVNDLASIIKNNELHTALEEYNKLISEKPEITDEDLLFIEGIINNSMNKKIKLVRRDDNNLEITLEEQNILGKTRAELPLSTGEQNFLSLTFEFLKAKNTNCPIVVIDDPISSFDSIYKNKIIYAIVRMLQGKNRLLFTHNLDLIRLLEGQKQGCFNLYLLNNIDGEENGFIPISKKEQDLLLDLGKLIQLFRETIFDHIIDVRLFLFSMIPFMRGYAKIIGKQKYVNQLTQVMHGYKMEKVDISAIYINLFGNKDNKIPQSLKISVPDILNMGTVESGILNTNELPLLNRTLCHSLTYLYLRLLVEKTLVDKYKIDTKKNIQHGQIIVAAYPDEKDARSRVRLTSKKTLINEFNHFEGNLSIFQPAIDITNSSLAKEKSDIEEFVNNLNKE